MTQVHVQLIEAGYTVHPGFIVERGGPWHPVPFPALCALIHHPKHGPVLYDVGYASWFNQATNQIPEFFYRIITPVTAPAEQTAAGQLQALGINPTDVRHIVLSHFHADHIGGAADFPNATYHVAAAGWDAVRGLGRWRATLNAYIPAFLPDDFDSRLQPWRGDGDVALPPSLSVLGKGWDLLGDGSIVAVSLPGHARGQLGLYIDDPDGKPLLFIADACWTSRSFEEFRPPNPITHLLFDSVRQHRQTLRHLHNIYRGDPNIRIIPSHCARAAQKEFGLQLSCFSRH
jgi:glyoxylase-like metal-dependent hydrolase (beta-lactamase superfamily II)